LGVLFFFFKKLNISEWRKDFICDTKVRFFL